MAQYEVRDERFFAGFTGDHGNEGDMAGHLLLMVDSQGQAEDHFKVVLTGGCTIGHTFPASAVTAAPSLAHYNLTVKRVVGSIHFKNNSFTSEWENLDELVASELIQASSADKEDADDSFRAAWAEAKESEHPAAAALRWSMQANEVHGFDLVLQGMPATARALRCNARLISDTAQPLSWLGGRLRCRCCQETDRGAPSLSCSPATPSPLCRACCATRRTWTRVWRW